MVAINAYTQYFLDAMNTWMTETGQTKIKMPNGEVVTLDSIKKIQGDIANKADLTRTTPQDFKGGIVSAGAVGSRNSSNDLFLSLDPSPSFLYKINGTYYRTTLPEKTGKMMLVGDYGIGGDAISLKDTDLHNTRTESYLFRQGGGSDDKYFSTWGAGINIKYDFANSFKLFINPKDGSIITNVRRTNISPIGMVWNTTWGSGNTTTDPQGFIKKASPIININPDGTFTTNDESDGATVA
ncbi:hypothetical protein I6G31_14885 [Proteus penneri]|uniref:Phage tail protein C-terminal domain-containing protein n=1 Tax=Proteus penneri TaxID=102862 RepID=A0ABS0W2H9_9GAMM|nr:MULTISPECIES: hypothetical protein [Proteus]MBJ2117110.1 hypothetical protein [Proteus penneri]NBM92748.1 hypothetical protein [Proteus sp. G2662]NBM97996.1 hypothetical protein [Proteus sp. G2660]NBN23672.1 hypothetical protein [Proteus sp. G2657]QPT33359.1 hypothetical protein I6G31_14885 [Proteus penneri]